MSERLQGFDAAGHLLNSDGVVKDSAQIEAKRSLLSPEDFARYISYPNGYPQTMLEVGVARGGTTAMSQVLACSPSFDGYGEDMLRNAIAYPLNRGEDPVLIQMPGEGHHIILKETYGPATESMIGHYPLKALQLAADRNGISKEEFRANTQLLAVTRDPLAIYNGWLKYWTIVRDVATIEEAYDEFGELSLVNLVEAYNCLTETVLNAGDDGIKKTVVITSMFENPPQGIQEAMGSICERLGVEFSADMIMFNDPKRDQKINIHPVTIDSKYVGLHEDIDNKGFRYFPPNYKYSTEVLPVLQKAGLLDQYQILHDIAEDAFGKIGRPSFTADNSN